MRLAFLELVGFRGYRKPLRIDFGDCFTIIDGRNGAGKSTIFDAIEFALTGRIGKYDEQKAAGESIDDYIWWRGEGPAPTDRYVKLAFQDADGEVTILRREFEAPDTATIDQMTARLCDTRIAPNAPLQQLCTNAIIRDEHITKLSLDLKETDRYALLRDALGAIDSDFWIDRASRLSSSAKRRSAAVQQEVNTANIDVATSARRLDEIRSRLVGEPVIAEAVERIRAFANTTAPLDQLAGFARERIAAITSEIDALAGLVDQWQRVEQERARLPKLQSVLEAAKANEQVATQNLQTLPAIPAVFASSSLSARARDLVALAGLGRKLGLHDGRCPLCAHGQAHDEFEAGVKQAELLARSLNESAARAEEQEQIRQYTEEQVAIARRELETAELALASVLAVIRAFDQRREEYRIAANATVEQVRTRLVELRQANEAAQRDLRLLETLQLSEELERAQRADAEARTKLARAQERFGRARRAETGAQALNDAARRAASETLDRRLERVLPLMSELYRRLKPHPTWSDIEYSIRGDVRRFLSLRVGESLNPQFLFSSGQRRATGLAFLLSVNLSLTWSRWRSILLDDPVQHIDDFRAMHLAELAAQLVSDGRQVVCAVEDAALADLLCRRLPIGQHGVAKRITLGADSEGAVSKTHERLLVPFAHRALATSPEDQPRAQ